MTIQQCRYTIEVANCGTFNEAAKRLFLAQSSLSSSIKELELELGIHIFERSKKGIQMTVEGAEFLEYAKLMVAQADFIEERYTKETKEKRRFGVSSQHYDFAAQAYSVLMNEITDASYDFHFYETTTYEVVEQVKQLESEIGVLFINDFNGKVMQQNFTGNQLEFHPLFQSRPHVFLGKHHPLASQDTICVEDLTQYPCITFGQNRSSILQFAEEAYLFTEGGRQIKVNDRATLLNLLVETNGYTIGSGIITSKTQIRELVSVPIQTDKEYTIGWVARTGVSLSDVAARYIEILSVIIHSSLI